MEVKQAEIVRTTIDLPAALNEKLLRSCEKSKRSRHAEMIYLLEKAFAAKPPVKMREAAK